MKEVNWIIFEINEKAVDVYNIKYVKKEEIKKIQKRLAKEYNVAIDDIKVKLSNDLVKSIKKEKYERE